MLRKQNASMMQMSSKFYKNTILAIITFFQQVFVTRAGTNI